MTKLCRFSILAVATACLLLASPEARAGILHTDPVVDTFGLGPDFIDLIGIETAFDASGGIYRISAMFNGSVSAASAFAADSVIGFIDIDADQNAATGGDAPWGGPVPGGNSWINFFVDSDLVPGPPVALGDEYYIDLSSEVFNPGFVDIVRTSDATAVGSVGITFTASSFEILFSNSLIGGVSNFNFAALVGTFNEPTDRMPNGSSPLQAVPEPSAVLTWLVLAGLAVPAYRCRRARTQA